MSPASLGSRSAVVARRRLRPVRWTLAVAVFMCTFASHQQALAADPQVSQADNGIHVGTPKVYDSGALEITLDQLAGTLKNATFISPAALASALNNLQSYSSRDFSQSFFANGAVGPNAASVFSGGSSAAPPASTGGTGTSPNVSINLSPSFNASSAAPAAPAPAAPATAGPQPPALPTLQTAPTFAPTFGENAAGVLSDEVNLTYQLDNVSMLLQRSLTDRLFRGSPRLQAVVDFDIDIEPPPSAKDAVAVVDVRASLADCGGLSSRNCDPKEPLSLVAMMPEEGSHNAATLSQKANAFGGALAAEVYSVGYNAQSRSQVFYLYRDIDTLSFQKAEPVFGPIEFGWQFRPVLGRKAVSAGMRHMIAVLALPAADLPGYIGQSPQLYVEVRTSWLRYHSNSQTVGGGPSFWARITGRRLPPASDSVGIGKVRVPLTSSFQKALRPSVSHVRWLDSGSSSGVALVTGRNFFPGTTVRFGATTYTGASDGLVIKSDQELEVALPLAAAITQGVISGRYGTAQLLQARNRSLPGRFAIQRLTFSSAGSNLYQIVAGLRFWRGASEVHPILASLERGLNRPIVSVNGTPLATPTFLNQDQPQDPITLTTFVPRSLAESGPTMVSVTFPFAGPGWSASLPHVIPQVEITRLPGKTMSRLLITSTDSTMLLCGYKPNTDNATHRPQSWMVALGAGSPYRPVDGSAPDPAGGGLSCLSRKSEVLALDLPNSELDSYHKLVLINEQGMFPPMLGDIPSQSSPPAPPFISLKKDPKDGAVIPSVSQYDVPIVEYAGGNLNQITKVLFDDKSLSFDVSDGGKEIDIGLAAAVTEKARKRVDLRLLSADGTFISAPLSVTAAAVSH